MAEFTHDTLRQHLHYDPETGVFTRLRGPTFAILGEVPKHIVGGGYLAVSFCGKDHRAHRLAWFYMTGEWPSGDVDHIDGNRTNNRWANLRGATRSQNLANSRKSAANTSGFKGVSPRNGRWRATVTVNYKQLYLGIFDCPAAAHFYYMIAADIHQGQFARTA